VIAELSLLLTDICLCKASMFSGVSNFNHDIGGWNVAKVQDMANTFKGASSFNQNIGSWNVGQVTSMSNMFNSATSFDQNIKGWNVANVAFMVSHCLNVHVMEIAKLVLALD